MTVQHVIERVKQQNSLVNSLEQDEKIIILNALEKQIPEKPHKINIGNTSWCKGGIRFECPSCHKFLRYSELTYCGLCGKHIDWSE